MKTYWLVKVRNPNFCRDCRFFQEVLIEMPNTTVLERGFTCLRRDCDNHIRQNRTVRVRDVIPKNFNT